MVADADAAWTADAAAIAACGLSFSSSAVADAAADLDAATADAAATIAVCGSSFSSSAAAEMDLAAANSHILPKGCMRGYIFISPHIHSTTLPSGRNPWKNVRPFL